MTMISGKDLYAVLTAVTPLYLAMLLAYGSVRWWKIFTPEQCSGINRFVMMFAFPFLSFNLIYSNNPYTMNFRFIASDTLQKLSVLVLLFLFHVLFANKRYGSAGSLGWVITLFSLASLPNTLIVGLPLLKAMYGDSTGDLMVQVVLLQMVVWFLVTLIMFEYRAAMIWISEQFPDTAGSIKSVRVESDVVSVVDSESLEAETEICDQGKLHVVVRRSFSNKEAVRRTTSFGKSVVVSSPSRPPDLEGVEIQQVRSSSQRDHHQKDNTVVSASQEESKVNKIEKGSTGGDLDEAAKQQEMPAPSVVIRLVVVIVTRKILRNPNCYASILGLIWALIAFR